MQCLPWMGLSMTHVVHSERSPPWFYVVGFFSFSQKQAEGKVTEG